MNTTIINYGTMGILFNFGANYGVQTGLTVLGGGAGLGQTTGLVFNYGANFGRQAGVYLN